MKILHISIYPPRGEKHSDTGGVASYTKNLITNIPRAEGDEVFVLCNKINSKFEKYLDGNINVIRCFDKNLKYFFQILKEVKEINPDVVHIQQELSLYGGVTTAYILQWLIFALRRYSPVVTLHGVVSLKLINENFVKQNNSKLPSWLVKSAFNVIYRPLCVWSKKVIVHEDYFKDILIGEYGVSKDKIDVIFHGVEDVYPISKKEACEKINLDSNRDISLFMGYLTGYKGMDLLIEEFAKYCKVNKNALLLIGAGKHPKLKKDKNYLREYARMEELAKDKIPANQYLWVGFIKESDIVSYYSASDISIYPYTVTMSSSGPMAIAIGLGRPFIASPSFFNVIPSDLLFENKEHGLYEKIYNFFENKDIYIDIVNKLRKERLWGVVGRKSSLLYESICKK